MTLATAKDNVESWRDSNIQLFIDYQALYQASNDVSWQGLPSHSVIPDGEPGSEEPWDNGSTFPTGQPVSWDDAFPSLVGVGIPCCLIVDSYGKSSQMMGFILELLIEFEGQKHALTLADGDDSSAYSSGWREV